MFSNMQLRIDGAKGRNANPDNVGSVIPVDFGEESRVGNSAEPFRWHVPNAIRVKFVALRHGYLE